MSKRDSDGVAFWTQLTSELLTGCQRRDFENAAKIHLVNQPAPTISSRIRNVVSRAAASVGLHHMWEIPPRSLEELFAVDGLDRAYALLDGESSRNIFVKLLAYRVLGPRHVRLPLNTPKYWELQKSTNAYVEKRGTISGIPFLGPLHLMNFNGLRFHAHRFNVLNIFLLEQYRYPAAGIGVKPGDVVIDAGACWGDTALYFAQNAEQVFCFECVPSNLKILEQNLALNPALAGRIRVIPKALWSRSGEKLAFEDRGPGSRPASNATTFEVETLTIDDLVSANSLGKIDLIKMDIEGCELEALIGATRTIRKYRPQLAICLYHKLSDFSSIPAWIASLNLGYRLYVDHFTIHAEETVLFARCD